MTFTYNWKTSDGTRQEGKIDASTRDEVFHILREKGIRPIKVIAADGSKANGEIRGVRKRVVVGIVLCVASVTALLAYWGGAHGPTRERRNTPRTLSGGIETEIIEVQSGRRVAKARPRQYLNEWHQLTPRLSNIFVNPSERILAYFAQPAELIANEIMGQDNLMAFEEDIYDVMDEPIWIYPNEDYAAAHLKRIVVGIKREVEMLLSSGKSPMEALTYLWERQKMEAQCRQTIITQYKATPMDLPDKRRALDMQLSAMGFAPFVE